MRFLLCTCLVLVSAQAALAQAPAVMDLDGFDGPIAAPATRVESESVVPIPATVTPEMWLYSQEVQRYDDPAQAVRRKAEYRGQQRANRIAAMKWFGKSNARPEASATPFMGIYSPAWVGNGYERYDWAAVGYPTPVVRYESHVVKQR